MSDDPDPETPSTMAQNKHYHKTTGNHKNWGEKKITVLADFLNFKKKV